MLTKTYLDMESRREFRPKRSYDPLFCVLGATGRQWQFNKYLYLLIGKKWQWTDKLDWSDAQWARYVESDALRTFAAYYDGAPVGYFELLSCRQNEVEIPYLGLVPEFIGRGFGGPLLSVALEKAWEMEPRRIRVHTSDLDHPNALRTFEARGFRVCKVACIAPALSDEKWARLAG